MKGRIEIPLPPSESDLGYLAGIMDGEGYFAASPKSNAFGLRVAMIDAVVIDWLHEHFAGNVSRAGKTSVGNRVHTWTLQRQDDLAYVLPRLIPRLVLKRAQAEEMLGLVSHLQARPRWDVPTPLVTRAERLRRRKLSDEWRLTAIDHRAAVRAARCVGMGS